MQQTPHNNTHTTPVSHSNVLIERLSGDGALICAEGFLFELERRGYLAAGAFVPEVVLEFPHVVEALHRDFQHAGSDIVQALTYYAHREKLRVIGKEALLETLNRDALRIAKKVAADVPGNLVAGNLSNSNIWVQKDIQTQNKIKAMFDEMTGWAVDEKADIIIAETYSYAEEAYAALDSAKQSGLPVVVTLGPMAIDTMLDGVGIVETCVELEQRGADVVGLNCFRGPATMMPWLQKIRQAVTCPVAALPVPYRTTNTAKTFFNIEDTNGCTCSSPHGRAFPTALDPLLCNRYEIGAFAKEAYNAGIRYLGVCCGASPVHIRQVAEAIGRTPPASRYSPNMDNHAMFGAYDEIPEHLKAFKENI